MPETVVNCSLCNSSRLNRILLKGRYGITKCSDCGLIFTNPRPTPDETQDLYEESYMANLESVKSTLFKICEKRLSFVERFKKGSKLLDVGSGNGYFLEAARRKGWEVSGTEISEYCIKYCRKEFGISLRPGEIFEWDFPRGYFDVITIWHTLEHVRDPMSYLVEFNRILKDDGLIFILVPNRKFLLNFFKGWAWIARSETREHLFFFSEETIKSMLQKADFKIVHRSIGNIESIRNCSRQYVINAFSLAGRAVYSLFGLNVGESVQIVAEKVVEKD